MHRGTGTFSANINQKQGRISYVPFVANRLITEFFSSNTCGVNTLECTQKASSNIYRRIGGIQTNANGNGRTPVKTKMMKTTTKTKTRTTKTKTKTKTKVAIAKLGNSKAVKNGDE
jgi:hypothetical protein